ncbi:hypothetical protein BEL01nite_73390 [Bradyrhizobium elkanii]|nr:hypothetical protein BEL01nite_73390 [Bradyrhizobium elkanii]
MAEVGTKAALTNLRINEIVVPRLTPILWTAGCTNDHVDTATLQDRQGLNNELVVFVAIELIGKIEVVRRQTICFDDFGWIRAQEGSWRPDRKADNGDAVFDTWIIGLEVKQSAFAT